MFFGVISGSLVFSDALTILLIKDPHKNSDEKMTAETRSVA